ncbi:putative DNA repair protein YkoV [compost metagenome]
MAKLLIEQLSTPFEPEKYTDDYRDNLLQLIEKKVAGEEISLAPAKPETNVIDLMAALQASIEAVKPGAAAAPAPIVTDPGPSKTKRTRKTAAKKTEETDAPAAVPKPKRKTTSKAAKKTIS